jgi:hypothetical protein
MEEIQARFSTLMDFDRDRLSEQQAEFKKVFSGGSFIPSGSFSQDRQVVVAANFYSKFSRCIAVLLFLC